MRRLFVRLLIILTLVAPATAWAADTWQPAGKWNLDMGDAACTLGRAFTAGQQQLTMGFRTRPLSNDVQLILVGPDSLFNEIPDQHAAIKIGVPGAAPVSGDLILDGIVGSGTKKVLIKVDRVALDELLAARSISLDGAGSAVTIATEASAGALGAMRSCEDDLYKRLKLDPAKLAAVAVWPETIEFLNKLSVDDYPSQALREKLEGKTSVLLDIDARGKVGDCQIIASSGSQLLDGTTCELIRTKASFQPAMDRNRRPIAAWTRMDFTWRLPRD